MFPMAGHSVQRIWTGFGVRPPYNLRIVTTGLVLPRNRATPEHPSVVGPAFHGVGIAATTAVVCRTTRHESAGCGMRVL